MSSIYPFAALRPEPGAAARVASVPYDVVSTDEARALAADNPLSFLHVSRPEIDLPPGTDPHGDQVYDKAVENFAALKTAAPLVTEDAPCFYVYRLHMGDHVQAGIAACFSVDEYDENLIRKHEKTRPDKEDDRTRHMLAIEAQTGRCSSPTRPRPRSTPSSRASSPVRRSSTSSLRTRSAMWCGGCPPPRRRPSRTALPRFRCSTSRTGITGPRARRGHVASCRRRARASGTASWPWPFPTTRCRCCPTTASCGT
ncbi:MAG: DUF1015 domain-containing protein [Vicinamibacterales bacterium]